jgi:AraC family transcriptional regulator, glycine betaine-responsive activator
MRQHIRHDRPPEDEPDLIAFLLVPDFPMFAFSAAIEPLRIANWISGRPLYEWKVLTRDGQPVPASNGCMVTPGAALESDRSYALVLVCSGVGGCHYRDRQVFAWLRRLARAGTRLGAICTAAYILARAGLLAGHRATIHWEDLDSFRSEFPELDITDALYEMDESRMTCSGGAAAMDMMLELIAGRHGSLLAGEIADQFMTYRPRNGSDRQRMSLDQRTGIRDRRLLNAIAAMEARLEDPLELSAICTASDLSKRHLQRLCHEQLGESPSEFYRTLRLKHARNLLLHGCESILEIATACGFVSASHFSRRYRQLFGATPSADRRRERTGAFERATRGWT